jgi:hypothetical protein
VHTKARSINPSSHPNAFFVAIRHPMRNPTMISTSMPRDPARAGVRFASLSSGTPHVDRVMFVEAALVSRGKRGYAGQAILQSASLTVHSKL